MVARYILILVLLVAGGGVVAASIYPMTDFQWVDVDLLEATADDSIAHQDLYRDDHRLLWQPKYEAARMRVFAERLRPYTLSAVAGPDTHWVTPHGYLRFRVQLETPEEDASSSLLTAWTLATTQDNEAGRALQHLLNHSRPFYQTSAEDRFLYELDALHNLHLIRMGSSSSSLQSTQASLNLSPGSPLWGETLAGFTMTRHHLELLSREELDRRWTEWTNPADDRIDSLDWVRSLSVVVVFEDNLCHRRHMTVGNEPITLCLDFTPDAAEGLSMPARFMVDSEGRWRDTIRIHFNVGKRKYIELAPRDVTSILSDGTAESDGETVIRLGIASFVQEIEFMAYDSATNQFLIAFVGTQAIPVLDGWRCAFFILLLLVFFRRAVSTATEIPTLQAAVSVDTRTTEWSPGVASPHTTLLVVDPLLYLLVIGYAIAYYVALGTILPPAPTYTAYWLWIALGAAAFLVGSVQLASRIHSQYGDAAHYEIRQFGAENARSPGAIYLEDVIAHSTFRSWFISSSHNPAHFRRVSVMNVTILRAMGYLLTAIGLLYILYWNTDNLGDWGLVVVVQYLTLWYMAYHTMEIVCILTTVGHALVSMVTLLYWFFWLGFTVVLTVFTVLDVFLPFAAAINGGVYTVMTEQFAVWMIYLVGLGVVMTMAFFNVTVLQREAEAVARSKHV